MNRQESRGSWWPPGCLLVGSSLIASVVLSVALSGPSNPYALIALVIAGLGAVSVACGLAVYGSARSFMDTPAAAVLATMAAVPPLLPAFGSASIELTGTALYVLVVAAAHAWLERSRASAVFAAIATVSAFTVIAIERMT